MNDLLNGDRTDRSDSEKGALPSDPETIKQLQDDSDRGPFLVVIALLVFIAVLIALFSTAVRSAEAESTAGPTAAAGSESAVKKPFPPDGWKPPVAKPIASPVPIDAELSKQILEKWGIEIISLNLTAAGYMIDFRFRVHDVDKALIFFDSRINPYLLVEKSHAKLPVPMAAKVGAFRVTNRGKNILPDKIYYIVFGNPDSHVKSGEKVTMVIGDFKAEHMTVH